MSKVCLVIGGTGGLGRACAEDLGSAGYKIVVAGRNQAKGNDIVNFIKSKGGEAIFIAFDICDPPSIKALHQEVIAKYGRLDAAINGAGVMGIVGKIHEAEPEAISYVMQNNFTGVVHCMQEQLKLMLNNPGGSGGSIVNFSSIYGLHGCKWGSIYSSAKYALIGLTKSAALEYANPKDNIMINAIAPGVVITEMTSVLDDPSVLPEGEMRDDLMKLKEQYPVRRFGLASDVAKATRFLIESPWVTGTVLEVDGGFGAK